MRTLMCTAAALLIVLTPVRANKAENDDIAVKYRDDPGASDRLTRTVMTGSDRRARHWAGKVSEVTMPPNDAVVTEAEARVLVNWLLVLVP